VLNPFDSMHSPFPLQRLLFLGPLLRFGAIKLHAQDVQLGTVTGLDLPGAGWSAHRVWSENRVL
jgi:hypothetical protein